MECYNIKKFATCPSCSVFVLTDSKCEALHTPGQYGSRISAGAGCRFLSFLGSRCSAANPLPESIQDSGSKAQQGESCKLFPSCSLN